MINAVLCKIFAVISWRVKTDDSFHAEFLENGQIVFGTEHFVLKLTQIYSKLVQTLVIGRTEPNQLIRNNPIEVSIFQLFKVFIGIQIKFLETEPLQLHGVLQTHQTVENLPLYKKYCALVRTVPIARISKRFQI
jgi:hypothetical protein